MWWSRINFSNFIFSTWWSLLGETIVVQKWNKSLITNWILEIQNLKKISLKKLLSVKLSKILNDKIISVRNSTTYLTITLTYYTYLGKQEFEKNRGLRLPISHSVLVYPYQHTKLVLRRLQDLILHISPTFLTQRDYLKHVWTLILEFECTLANMNLYFILDSHDFRYLIK